MGLLKAEPTEVVESLPELMAIAHAMEEEAVARYGQLAERMRRLGNRSAAEVFDHLSREEQAHVDKVTHWSEEVVGKAPDPADIRWQLPETLDDEGMADLATSHLVTPYRALSIAVRNEERAFAFWSYVAAHSRSDAVRRQAENMAREELHHVRILRRERRRAYHRQREGAVAPGRPGMLSLGRFKAEAAALERRIRTLCAGLADAAARNSDARTADLLGRIAEESADNLRSLEAAAPMPAGEADARSAIPQAGLVGEALKAVEAASDRYLQVADLTSDEEVVWAAQNLSKSAIRRLVLLRELSPTAFEDAP